MLFLTWIQYLPYFGKNERLMAICNMVIFVLYSANQRERERGLTPLSWYEFNDIWFTTQLDFSHTNAKNYWVFALINP